jgi:hypothetical protein
MSLDQLRYYMYVDACNLGTIVATRDLLFSDAVVTPTELASEVRRITQAALHHPVTIHRTEGDLALLARDKVSELTSASSAIEDVVDFGRNFLWILRGKGRPSPAWEWLQLFSPDDVANFLDECLSALDQALHGLTEWDLPTSVLHEWRERARALSNQSLLAEWATFRGVVAEDEAGRLTPDELRIRLTQALKNPDMTDAG